MDWKEIDALGSNLGALISIVAVDPDERTPKNLLDIRTMLQRLSSEFRHIEALEELK
jgi:hypothetical protein